MPNQSPRIALIHATPLAMEPIHSAFERHWPQARRMNLLDDSLSADRAQAGHLDEAMVQRFIDLAGYAKSAGCDAILFTCSAFGLAIEAAARTVWLPTLKPNEAMFEEALAGRSGDAPVRLGLLATFEPSIGSMSDELHELAAQRGIVVQLQTAFVPGALDDLARGQTAEHHRKVADAARDLRGCDALMLAQFSMAAALDAAQAQTSCPVMSSPDCAVLALRRKVANA